MSPFVGLTAPPLDADIPGEPAAAAVVAFRRLTLATEQFRHAIAHHHGVGHTELVALINLGDAGPLSARDLATRLSLTPSSVTAVIDRLEAAELAARAPHPTDRRRIQVTITVQGEKLIELPRQRLHEALSRYGENQSDLMELTGALTRLAELLFDHSHRISAGEPEAGQS